MNVNELADELWNWEESLFRDASTMLRQQQAEIERLTMLCKGTSRGEEHMNDNLLTKGE